MEECASPFNRLSRLPRSLVVRASAYVFHVGPPERWEDMYLLLDAQLPGTFPGSPASAWDIVGADDATYHPTAVYPRIGGLDTVIALWGTETVPIPWKRIHYTPWPDSPIYSTLGDPLYCDYTGPWAQFT